MRGRYRAEVVCALDTAEPSPPLQARGSRQVKKKEETTHGRLYSDRSRNHRSRGLSRILKTGRSNCQTVRRESPDWRSSQRNVGRRLAYPSALGRRVRKRRAGPALVQLSRVCASQGASFQKRNAEELRAEGVGWRSVDILPQAFARGFLPSREGFPASSAPSFTRSIAAPSQSFRLHRPNFPRAPR